MDKHDVLNTFEVAMNTNGGHTGKLGDSDAESDQEPEEKKVSLLLVEDDSEQTFFLQNYLEANGFSVTTVGTGVDALHEVMARDFELILCDMLMPKMPGDMFFTAVERVRPHLCGRFLFMTGYKREPRIDAFIRRVRGNMLWKPFPLEDMLVAIKAILDKNRRLEPAAT